MKGWAELKAEPLDTPNLDRWLAGRISRRVLVVPFGGPLPTPANAKGMDIDGEWFDAGTDLVGPFPVLGRTRDRVVDWHHDADPTGVMKGATLGHVVMDSEPSSVTMDGSDYEGVWADFWANAGERRRSLVARLERQGATLYGSSAAVPGAARKASTGRIEVWPLIRHTISTSPQNTHAIVPPVKALLDMALDGITLGALKSLLLGMDLGTAEGLGTGTAGLTDAQARALGIALDELSAYVRA